MGAVRAILDETTNQLKPLGNVMHLNLEGTRRIQMSSHRYCLHGDRLYLPAQEGTINAKTKLSWIRFRVDVVEDFPELGNFNVTLPYSLKQLYDGGVGIGSHYSKRHRELGGSRVPVSTFCAQSLINEIAENHEVLNNLSKEDFESLVAELFVRKGFEVDLYRPTKDEGIDFLAIRGDREDPFIFAVQVKHPDTTEEGRNKILVPVVREIYGVSKYYGLQNAVVVTSGFFSRGAKAFQQGKPDEIQLHDREALLEWIFKFRWNPDE
jgi:hypothetical protein